MEKMSSLYSTIARPSVSQRYDKDDAFIKEATTSFEEKFGHAPKVYDVVISDGARRVE